MELRFASQCFLFMNVKHGYHSKYIILLEILMYESKQLEHLQLSLL